MKWTYLRFALAVFFAVLTAVALATRSDGLGFGAAMFVLSVGRAPDAAQRGNSIGLWSVIAVVISLAAYLILAALHSASLSAFRDVFSRAPWMSGSVAVFLIWSAYNRLLSKRESDAVISSH